MPEVQLGPQGRRQAELLQRPFDRPPLDPGPPDERQAGYISDNAPCVCVSGQNQGSGLHGVFHGLQDVYERGFARSGKEMTYALVRNRALAIHQRIFKSANCDYACIGHSLDEFHKPPLGKDGENSAMQPQQPKEGEWQKESLRERANKARKSIKQHYSK
jgi:hypothetical protein